MHNFQEHHLKIQSDSHNVDYTHADKSIQIILCPADNSKCKYFSGGIQ